MSALARALAESDSGFDQYVAARRYFGASAPRGMRTLARWCDLRRRGHPDETMADLLESGAVSEAEVRDCFLEAA